MASAKKPLTMAPGDDLVAALAAQMQRARKAISETEFTREEAAVVEWLLAPQRDTSYSDFRRRFEHRVTAAEDESLAKITGLLNGIVGALIDNNGAALSDAAALFEVFFAINDQQSKLIAGHRWVAREARSEDVDDVAPWLVNRLTVLDGRFGQLERDVVAKLLAAVQLDSTKGGSGNLSAVGAFAKMIAKVGAFDIGGESAASKEAAASKKIRAAIGKRADRKERTKVGRSRSARPQR